MTRLWLMLLVVLLVGSVPLLAEPTFSQDVAPILYKSCAPCHHDGGIGPFPLTSYDEIRKRAAQIADVTQRRYMPPWPPQPGYGDFEGDRHLNQIQISTIAAWVKSGEPRGNSASEPRRPIFEDGWQMGKPDLVLRMSQPFHLPASGTDLFRNFVIPNTLTSTRYVRGFELRLNTKGAVHHANVVLDRTQSLRRRDGQDGKPGFAGMDVITEAAPNDFDPDSHFLFWKPASALEPEPDDLSWRLDTGTDLVLNLHLQPTGKEENVEAEIGLYFASHPPTKLPMLIQLEHDGAIRIPPGDRAFTVTDHLTLPEDIDVLAIYPHAHYLGKLIEAWADLPDGTRRPLIRIPDWDINWQATYEYRRPVHLSKGTTVAMKIVYDNSAANPRNPNHPPRLVATGDRSQDEMGHVWLQVLPTAKTPQAEDPRWALQEAVMRRRLEKYPNDFLAEYNLGAFLQSCNRLPEAETAYRSAIRTQFTNATAHNSLGTVLFLTNKMDPAILEYRQALALDPAYSNARYNLARALASNRNFTAAEAEYRSFLKQQPNDTDALTNLGTVLALQGDLREAIPAFEAALRLDPNNETAQKNLARAQAAIHKKTN